MLYPQDIEQKLGFDKIRVLLTNHCSGQQGKNNVAKIKFSSNKNLILKLCVQTEEYVKMVEAGEKIPALSYPEIDHVLDKLKVVGIFLEIEEVVNVQKTLKNLYDWSKYLSGKRDEYVEKMKLHLDGLNAQFKELEAKGKIAQADFREKHAKHITELNNHYKAFPFE